MYPVLIVEDDDLHRGFLRSAVEQIQLGGSEIIEATEGEQAIRLANELQLRGAVLDLQLPRKSGVQIARAIWARSAKVPIVFWSNYADEAYVRGIMKIVPPLATYGYLLKTSSLDRLMRSIECVLLEGQNIVDGEIRRVQQRGGNRSDSLTESEYEVLLDVAIGLTDQAIANRRRVSLRSAQGRLQQLYQKLGLLDAPTLAGGGAEYNQRTRAVAKAMILGLINPKSIESAELEYRQPTRQGDMRR